jgi:GGDEF domain-containing protein
MEPWVLAALAFSMAASAVFLWPDLPASWALALVPLLAARWAQARPARHPSELALRGTLIVAGALLLHFHGPADADAAALLARVWLGAACAGYAFMLRTPWSTGVAAFALLILAALHLLSTGELPATDTAAQGSLAILLPALLAAIPGALLRRAHARREGGRVDPATGLFSHEGLLADGEDLLERCRRRRQPVTLAVFDCSDLLEVRRIYGGPTARQVALKVARKLAGVAGERGLAARTGAAEFAVLLPGLPRERALQAVQQVLGTPSRIEYESDGNEIVLVPNFLLVMAGDEDEDVAELYASASRKLAWAREHEARRQRYLRRERERHSRPMALPGDTSSGHGLEPTLQVPLAASS